MLKVKYITFNEKSLRILSSWFFRFWENCIRTKQNFSSHETSVFLHHFWLFLLQVKLEQLRAWAWSTKRSQSQMAQWLAALNPYTCCYESTLLHSWLLRWSKRENLADDWAGDWAGHGGSVPSWHFLGSDACILVCFLGHTAFRKALTLQKVNSDWPCCLWLGVEASLGKIMSMFNCHNLEHIWNSFIIIK